MTVNILTVFPEMFESVFAASILGRAREQGLLDIRLTDIRAFRPPNIKTPMIIPSAAVPEWS